MKLLNDKKLDKDDPMNSKRKMEKEIRRKWRETNFQTKHRLYKTIGKALAQQLGVEVPIARIDGGQHIIYTSENGIDFVIKVTQKRNKVNYMANSVTDICSTLDENDGCSDQEWLDQIQRAMENN